MTRFPTLTTGAVFAACLLTADGVGAADLTQPDCDRIAQWAAGYDSHAMVELRPGVKVNALLGDDQIVPLFGKSLAAWGNDGINQVSQWIFQCRQAANKTDKARGRTINDGLQLVKRAGGPLQQIDRARAIVTAKVDALAKPSSRVDVTPVIDLARRALNGENVEAEVQKLPRETMGYGRNVLEIARYRPMLSDDDVAPLLAKLNGGQAAAMANRAQNLADLQALLAKVATVPETSDGVRALKGFTFNHQKQVQALPQADRDVLSKAIQDRMAAVNDAIYKKNNEAQAHKAH